MALTTSSTPRASNQRPGNQKHASKKVVEEGYDQIAPRYLEWATGHSSPRLKFLDKVLDLLPEKSKVLELGCGAGVPCTQKLIARGHEVTGNDISEKQIELARENVPNAHFLKGDMMSLDFEGESFLAVVAFYSVIHLPRDEQKDILGKIRNWLADDGYLLLNLGTRDDPGSTNENWLGGKMFWSSFDAERNVELIMAAGFDLIEAEVTNEEEDGVTTHFLWILAKKRKTEEN